MKYTKFIFVIFFLFQVYSYSQEYRSYTTKEARNALIIGNSDYYMGILANPVNDARAMARVLRNVDFNVLLYENVSTKDEMKMAIRKFGNLLRNNKGVGLFYFAGHGIQVNGFNYLIPVHAEITTEEEVEYEAVDVGFVLAQMESAENRVNIVIFDACRNNPFARTFRSANRGLASINAPRGSLIAYATAPGSTASDGTGDNGLYTGELLKQINRNNLKIEDVFKNVRAEVVVKSNEKQIPWESSSLIGDFYFSRTYPEQTENKTTTNLITNVPKENIIKEPEVLWKANDEGYWIYMNDKEITYETTNQVKGENLMVIHEKSKSRFLLNDYFNSLDNTLRKAEIIEYGKTPEVTKKQDIVEWKAVKDYYWLYVNGKDISKETQNSWEGPHLKVYHPKTKKTYLLKNFNDCLDNTLRKAEIVE